MAFELYVLGGKRIGLGRWRSAIAALGIAIDFHPRFDLATHSGWLPLRFTVTSSGLFPGAAAGLGTGPLRAGFELETRPAKENRQVLAFITKDGRTKADYLAQTLCAAAYALEAHAILEDPQSSAREFQGRAIRRALREQLEGGFFADPDTLWGEAFVGW